MPPDRPGALRLMLEVPARARPGEPVLFRLRVTNVGDASVEFTYRGRGGWADFDLVVTGPGGELVWDRLRGRYIPDVEGISPPLAAGESIAFEETWEARTDAGEPAPPGEYLVRAAFRVSFVDDPDADTTLSAGPEPLPISPT